MNGGQMSVTLTFSIHALRQMFQRRINTTVVRFIIEHGEVIESYPNDTPWPSRLLLGLYQGRPIHVVAAWDQDNEVEVIITVYEPNLAEWSSDFRRRLT